MTKNLEKINVFGDLDLESILGGFWEGFGRPKTSIFALLGKFLGRLGRRETKGKKKKEKKKGREAPNTQLQSLTLGRYLYKG